MSALTNKINSYAIERGISFDETYTGAAPTLTGSNTSTQTFTESGSAPIINIGGPQEALAWRFNGSETAGVSKRLRNTGNDTSLILDNSYSVGFWVKIPGSFPTTVGAVATLHSVRPPTQGYLFSAYRDSNSQSQYFNQRIFNITISNNSGIILNQNDHPSIKDDVWNYVAIRRNGSTAGIYLNGVGITTLTGINVNTGATAVGLDFGNIFSPYNYNVDFSSFYIAPYEEIDGTDIAEIWAIGNAGTPNIKFDATPLTASGTALEARRKIDPPTITADAMMVHPTIVIVANDNVEITTSIVASAEFPQNVLINPTININNVITEVLTASGIFGDNVVASSGTNASVSSTEMTASALLVEPVLPESAMTASATMPGGNVVVQTNYFNLVTQLSPYIYINNGLAIPVNYGTQSGTFVKGINLVTNQDGGLPLNIIADGKSWLGSTLNNSDGFFTFETTNFADSFHNVLGTGNFAYEVWVKPRAFPSAAPANSSTTNAPLYAILNSDKLKLLLDDAFTTGGVTTSRYFSLIINNDLSTTIELRASIDPTFSLNNWNHVVVNAYQPGINANERLIQLWVNGQILINQTIAFTPWSDTTNKINYVLGSNATSLTRLSDMYYDELAIYESPLTNTQIIQHNQFITTYSPNYIDNAAPFIASAISGNNNFIAQSNTIIAETPATSSALFVNPAVSVSTFINVLANPMLSNALNTDVTVFYGRTFVATPMISAAESKEGFFINDAYYEYVQTNIAPYRYVNFDNQNEYLDYGTDNDYSVVSTVVGGTIIGQEFGITGKSAKTAGTSYVTDGVILKESEWNDSWGTGQNSYHSAFWFQRALDDASTTGLRVLWNLNGYKDNQHVVLYQYQNKLHMQFNNGSGTWIEQDTGILDLFDYNRHFIVIEFDHTNNNNNIVRLYVDAVLKMTVNLGVYTGTTTNASSADSGPNDEANNRPRLSIGCLITPFASTALPVAPANTKLIIDEVYWDKNSITAAMVINLFNTMPDKGNNIIIVDPMTASCQSIMPIISTIILVFADPFTASAGLPQPVIVANREVIYNANVMTATALAVNATVFENRIVLSDIFVATSIFNNPGIEITVPGPTMIASVKLQSSGIYLTKNGSNVRYYPNKVMTPWLAYLRATDVNNILPMREVK